MLNWICFLFSSYERQRADGYRFAFEKLAEGTTPDNLRTVAKSQASKNTHYAAFAEGIFKALRDAS